MRTPDFRSPEWPAGSATPSTPAASPEAPAEPAHRATPAGQHARGFASIMHQKLAHAPQRPEKHAPPRPTTTLKFAAKTASAPPTQRAQRPQRDADASRGAHPPIHAKAAASADSAATEPDSDVDTGASTAPTNILVLPLPGVIIPFPAPLPPSPPPLEATRNPGAGAASESAADPLADVEIDVAWPGWRAATARQDPPSNVTPIDFRTSDAAASADAPTNIVAVDFGTPPGVNSASGLNAAGQSHLPGPLSGTEESAASAQAEQNGQTTGARSASGAKPRLGVGFARGGASPAQAGGPRGTPAAQEGMSMGSLQPFDPGNSSSKPHSGAGEELEGITVKISQDEVRVEDRVSRNPGATEWQMGRPVGAPDRPASELQAAGPESAGLSLDRLSNLLLRETTVLRQHPSDSMTVVLRPDSQTELFVHFHQQNGVMQASVRCERGDFHQLNALWSQLRESLAQQKVSLAPLQQASSDRSNLNPSTDTPSGWAGHGGDSGRRQAPDRHSMDEWPTPASANTASAATRGRGGSRSRLTTSRPGWETWA